MCLKIKMKKVNTVPVLTLIGQAVGADVNALSKKMESLAAGSNPVVVIDLSETSFIDSHGLGILVFMVKSMEANNKRLVFLNPQGVIREILWETNLNKIFPIINSMEEL